ncbi:MAG: hypothetical protein JXR10_01090 [Cyclobacteriaceae bacterium]
MKFRLCILISIIAVAQASSQGVSVSYLIPKNGYLAAPISPFSIRGVGIGNIVGAETGITLYSIPGLAMEDLPFDYTKPLVGPHYSLLAPIQLFIKIPSKILNVKLLAGGFLWLNINPRINEGNMDRAFRDYESWTVANTDFDLKSKLGTGWMAGIEFEFKASQQFSITSEFSYLLGGAQTQLSGNYTGGDSVIETKSFTTEDATILIQGIEISLGVKF